DLVGRHGGGGQAGRRGRRGGREGRQGGDDEVGQRRAQAGGQVEAGGGGVVGRAGGRAAGDVVGVGAGEAVELRDGLGVAAQDGQAGQGAALVGDGDQGGPLRGAGAGAADRDPGGRRPVVEAVVDRDAGAGVGVVSDVGGHALAVGIHGAA